MNAEQKQRSMQAIEGWQSVRNDDPMKTAGDVLAAMLQELVDAPEPEPVLTLTVSEAGGFRVWATNTCPGYIPAGEHLLYLAPPAPSVPELEEYDAGFLNDFGGGNVGWWQDYIRAELGSAYEFYCSQLSAAQTPAEPPTDVARDVRLQVESEFAAPQPPRLSDERILEIWASNSGRPVTMGKDRIIAQARAIEREILGGEA